MNTHHLTPKQINRAIAEFCGTEIKDGWFVTYRSPKHGDAVWAPVSELPNYHGDLNACREAVLKLPERYLEKLFTWFLPQVMGVGEASMNLFLATPEQLSLAIVLTIKES